MINEIAVDVRHLPDSFIANVSSSKFRLTRTTRDFENPYTGFRRSEVIDVRWEAELGRPHDRFEEWTEYEAFFDDIKGIAGFFTMWDTAYPVPRGIASGIGRGDAEFQEFADNSLYDDQTGFLPPNSKAYIDAARPKGADSLELRGLVSSARRVLYPNDRFSIRHGPCKVPTLYKAVKAAHSNADGKAGVKIAPSLRFPVIPGDSVIFFRPRGVFQLSEPFENSRERPLLGNSDLKAVEAPEVLDIIGLGI